MYRAWAGTSCQGLENGVYNKMKMEKVGELAFLAVVVIAVLAGLLQASTAWVTVLLVLLGLVVGFLNVSEKETAPFLIASIALVVAATATFSSIDTVIGGLGTIIDTILNNVATFVAPAAVLVALKAVYTLASKK